MDAAQGAVSAGAHDSDRIARPDDVANGRRTNHRFHTHDLVPDSDGNDPSIVDASNEGDDPADRRRYRVSGEGCQIHAPMPPRVRARRQFKSPDHVTGRQEQGRGKEEDADHEGSEAPVLPEFPVVRGSVDSR